MAYIGRTTDGFGVRQRFLFTPDAGATSVSGTDASGATLTFSDSVYMDVFLNGVLLKAGTDYNTNTANTIAGLTATVANDEVTVLVYDIFTTADMVSATSGGTFTGNIAMSGTLGVTGATTAAAITASGVIKTDDTTDSTSTTTGSIQTDGGVGIAKDLVVGDDVLLTSDAALVRFGADSDVTLTHEADTGLLLNSTMALQFNDASQSINAPSATVLDINATDEIELNATAVDLNGTLDVSGASTLTGNVALGGTLDMNGGELILDADADSSIHASSDDTINFKVGGTDRVTMDVNGDVRIDTGDIFFATAGKGICLGITTNTDANTLDDYEEGTWTAVIDTAAGSVTLASGTDLCSYTKIGNMVTVRGKISVASVSSPSGVANMTGLPFTSQNTLSENAGRSGGAMLHDTLTGMADHASVVYQTFENTTTVNLFEQNANGVANLAGHLQASSLLIFELSYPV